MYFTNRRNIVNSDRAALFQNDWTHSTLSDEWFDLLNFENESIF